MDFIEDADVVDCIEGEDVVECIEGDDVMDCIEGEDVVECIEGDDVVGRETVPEGGATVVWDGEGVGTVGCAGGETVSVGGGAVWEGG